MTTRRDSLAAAATIAGGAQTRGVPVIGVRAAHTPGLTGPKTAAAGPVAVRRRMDPGRLA